MITATIYGMTPAGRIDTKDAQTFQGESHQDVLTAIQNDNPFTGSIAPAEFMTSTLARIGVKDWHPIGSAESAAAVFLEVLQHHGLAKLEYAGPKTQVKVRLVGEDGNAMAIIGRISKALQRAGYGRDFISAFQVKAMSSDYTHLLATAMEYVAEPDDDEE